MATSTAAHTFRRHDDVAPMQSPLLIQLGAEWVDLNASSNASETIDGWALQRPALAGLHSPGDVVDHIDDSEPAEQDRVLLALLELLQNGDQLAGRILLQAMLPGLILRVWRCVGDRSISDFEEALQRAVTEFWCVAARPRTRPLRRKVAGRLLLDTVNRLTAHRRSTDAWDAATSAPAYYEEYLANDEILACCNDDARLPHHPAETTHDLDPHADVYELIISARRTGILSPADAQFLTDVYLSPTPEKTLTQAAARLGMTQEAVRQRAHRIGRRLSDAVLAQANADRAQSQEGVA